MHTIRFAAWCVAWSAVAMAAAAAPKGGGGRAAAPTEGEDALIQVLKSDAPPAEKAITCKKLAICGTKAAVPALAALLPNEQLASWARIGLEAIPDPAADDALRDALGKLKGRLLVGAINSLGRRRDAKAVDPLVGLLKDADADVASAAAAALGRIGGERPAKALEPMLAGAPVAARSAVAEGCVLCAERFLDEGKRDEAAKLYDAVRKADVPLQRRLEGIRGAILARQTTGIPLLIEQVKSADKAHFGIGLRVARELPGSEATDALMAAVGSLPPDRQTLVILAVADRGDAKAVAVMTAAAKSGPAAARIAAMGALERFGNASCVPVLLAAAIEDDAKLAQTAKLALAKMPGKDVDADLAARLPNASGKARQVLVELAGQRKIEAALPALARCVEDADPAVRAASMAALGAVGGGPQVPAVVKVLQSAKDPKEREEIEKALLAVCGRGGAASATAVTPLLKSGDAAIRVIALHALAGAGGPEALAAVQAAIGDGDETVQDEAVRTLSGWPSKWPDDAGVTGPLLALVKSGKKTSHQILALRGYLQYIQGATKLGESDKLAKLKDAIPLITRPEEKRLAMSVLGTIGSTGALDMLVGYVADLAAAEEACAAIVQLAGKKDLKGIPPDQLRKALQTAADKAKDGRTKKKAQDLLKAIP
jgi:HEAT repeat protein